MANPLAGKVLFPLKPENPRRANTKGFKSYQIILDAHKEGGYKGVKFEKFIELGGRSVDARWDIDRLKTVEVREA